MKTLYALMLAVAMAGMSACQQKPVEEAAPVAEEMAPAAPVAEDANAVNPAEAEGAAPAAAPAGEAN